MTDEFIAPPCEEQIEILFEDESLLVINKPSGLLSLSGKNPLNKDSVYERLLQQYPNAKMVHRLDFGTSGIMLVALNSQAIANLNKQFQLRTVKKTYTAILHGSLRGNIETDRGEITAPIARAEFPYQKICSQSGKHAKSLYRVVERGESCSRVLFTPVTGRTHQLRVHSHSIGHPILGCDLYDLMVDGKSTRDMAQRLMLHATSLLFDHPISAERLQLECACPF